MILDDREKSDSRHVVVVRSSVRLDDGQNKTIHRTLHKEPISKNVKGKDKSERQSDSDEEVSPNKKSPDLEEDDTSKEGEPMVKESELHRDVQTETEKRQNQDERTPTDEHYSCVDIISHRIIINTPEFLILWSNGEQTWEPFRTIKEDMPEDVAIYVEKHNLGSKFCLTWARLLTTTLRRLNVNATKTRKKDIRSYGNVWSKNTSKPCRSTSVRCRKWQPSLA
jgi:hypothetical protein